MMWYRVKWDRLCYSYTTSRLLLYVGSQPGEEFDTHFRTDRNLSGSCLSVFLLETQKIFNHVKSLKSLNIDGGLMERGVLFNRCQLMGQKNCKDSY